jgi:hypothetical protein
MGKNIFLKRIKKLNLNKKEFAGLCKVPYSTVNNWGTTINNKILSVPAWVEPFLDYYEKSIKLDYVMDEICMKIKEVKV